MASHRGPLLIALLFVLAGAPALAGEAREITVYKSPSCGCCGKWVEHLEANGFRVEVHDVADMHPIKQEYAVPDVLASCHTASIDGYVIEGHVPAADIARLLKERPPVRGLSVPGMKSGTPGMEGPDPERYQVLSFDDEGHTAVFATHAP
jgi:hypothetical protein